MQEYASFFFCKSNHIVEWGDLLWAMLKGWVIHH
jgi:hypothetical protein